MLWISIYFAAQLSSGVLALESRKGNQMPDIGEEIERYRWDCELWPGGAVIYTIEPIVGCPNSSQCRVIMDAIKNYEKRTCIRFKIRSGEKDYVKITYDPDRNGCSTVLGRVGGEQTIILGNECWAPDDVTHEFGHSLGLPDEVTRPDRDDYIGIDFDQIREENLFSFKRVEPRFPVVLEEPFDYFSVMMYEPRVAGKSTEPTLYSKTSQRVLTPEEKSGLSVGDVKKIGRLYGCTRNYQDPSFPFDVTCTFDNDECGFRNLDDVQWRRTNKDFWGDRQRKGYIYVDFDAIEYQPARFASVNFHGLSPRDTVRGPMGCLTFSYKISTPGRATLDLSLMKLNSPHQLFYRSAPSSLWTESKAANSWTKKTLPVPVSKPFALVFRAKFKETTTKGTISVDDLLLSYHPCLDLFDPLNSSPSPKSSQRKSFRKTLSKLSIRAISKGFSTRGKNRKEFQKAGIVEIS